jgi:SAM-dependent methyltransferase
VLTRGAVYDHFQRAITRKPIWRDICQSLFSDSDESEIKVLDIGCGTGNFFRGKYMELSQHHYVGIDPSENYIKSAQSSFPNAVFYQGLVDEVELDSKCFGLVVLSGVLHHLSDDEATQVISYARDKVIDGGYVVSVDPVVFDGQNWIAKKVALADRGQHVRTPEQLSSIYKNSFQVSETLISIKHGYLRLPYNHVVCISQPIGKQYN